MTACQLCRGACCEYVVVKRDESNDDKWDWLCYHGEVTGNVVKIPTPCSKFRDGGCSIYPDRPKMCRDFRVGCSLCVQAVSTRSNKDDIMAAIRHEVKASFDTWVTSHD